VSKPHVFGVLALCLSEKQTPQVIVVFRKSSESQDPLDRGSCSRTEEMGVQDGRVEVNKDIPV